MHHTIQDISDFTLTTKSVFIESLILYLNVISTACDSCTQNILYYSIKLRKIDKDTMYSRLLKRLQIL